MITRVFSSAPLGIGASPVEVEADVSFGLPQFTIVGLPDQAVKESKDRVRAALKNSGFEFPLRKVTINLAPADLKKEGPIFDLAIAICILAAEGHVNPERLIGLTAIGELGLDGKLRMTRGTIQSAYLAKRNGGKLLFPSQNAREAALLDPEEFKEALIPLGSLKEAVAFINEGHLKFSFLPLEASSFDRSGWLDFRDVKGQAEAKRAIEVAVSGGHNLLMVGPPGGGKTMLARRIPSVLPRLSKKEALEVSMIYSTSDEIEKAFTAFFERPFRAPHHSLSVASLVGGGAFPKPGEVSLAHRGVLFLDELSEFQKNALEALRQPLEDKKIMISRVNGTLEFPSAFMLVAASNPCRCGYLNSKFRACRCSPAHIESFRSKLSGPLLDRIDIQVAMPEVAINDLRKDSYEEDSETIRTRVEAAREIQAKRYLEFSFKTNSEMNERALKLFVDLDSETESFFRTSLRELGLSARAHTRVLKIARTLADMEESERIEKHHLEEALGYRLLDRQFIQI